MLFKTLAERWLRDLEPRSTPRTLEQARHCVRVLCRRFGGRSSLTADDIRDYVQFRRRTCAVATVNGDLTVLRAILRWGRKRGSWFGVPEIQLLPRPRKIPRTIPRDGIERLFAVCDGRIRAFVLLARFTLARHQEVLGCAGVT